MYQCTHWSALRQPGDWVIERRWNKDKSKSFVMLCMMDQRVEQACLVPPEVVAACEAAKISIAESYDWDFK